MTGLAGVTVNNEAPARGAGGIAPGEEFDNKIRSIND